MSSVSFLPRNIERLGQSKMNLQKEKLVIKNNGDKNM
jgi:hypothetical protein